MKIEMRKKTEERERGRKEVSKKEDRKKCSKRHEDDEICNTFIILSNVRHFCHRFSSPLLLMFK